MREKKAKAIDDKPPPVGVRTRTQNPGLAARMARAMADNGFTKNVELSRAARVSEMTAGNWLRGEVSAEHANAGHAMRIADALNVRMRWLLYDEEPMRERAPESVRAESMAVDELTMIVLALLDVSQAMNEQVSVELLRRLNALPESARRPDGLVMTAVRVLEHGIATRALAQT